MSSSTDVNYRYFEEYIRRLPEAARLRVLDYGCGRGELVAALRESGLDCVGCDLYYEGAGDLETPRVQALIRAGHIAVIQEQGDLPFEPASFDVVVANMVFEHVRDLPAVLDRLHRVLRPGGHILAHFPTREVAREGHIGIPFFHRFRKGSRLRRLYTLCLRSMGVGYFKRAGESASEWTDRQISWVDSYCHYRSTGELRRTMAGRFSMTFNEMPYIRFRARTHPWLQRLLHLPGAEGLWCALFRRAAFTALLLRPLPVRTP